MSVPISLLRTEMDIFHIKIYDCRLPSLMAQPAGSDVRGESPLHFDVEALLRRGDRSDVRLSCTETRFQKYTQSGKSGPKHPMLSISLAFNVISCKKSKGNKKIKLADFTM